MDISARVVYLVRLVGSLAVCMGLLGFLNTAGACSLADTSFVSASNMRESLCQSVTFTC